MEEALVEPSDTVMLFVYEWSGPASQSVVVPWTRLKSKTDLDGVAALLAAPEAKRAHGQAETAVGMAMLGGAEALGAQDCDRRVLDLASDGLSNAGPEPAKVQADRDWRESPSMRC